MQTKSPEKCLSHIILKESGAKKKPRACLSENIAIYIMWKGKKLPICFKCWIDEIAERDIEWE